VGFEEGEGGAQGQSEALAPVDSADHGLGGRLLGLDGKVQRPAEETVIAGT